MRSVVQKVLSGSVTVNDHLVSSIQHGLVVLLGVEQEDSEKDASYLAEKIACLRIFEDEAGKMNLSVQDVAGDVLAVSQFTLYGDCRRGRRPSYSSAAPPDKAKELYLFFVQELRRLGLTVNTGIFQEHMVVNIVNDGPVTILLDSQKIF